MVYVWHCALTHRRGRWLNLASGVLIGEGIALTAAKGCPIGMAQRRMGDDISMFERWLGPRHAPFAIPTLTGVTLLGFAMLVTRGREVDCA